VVARPIARILATTSAGPRLAARHKTTIYRRPVEPHPAITSARRQTGQEGCDRGALSARETCRQRMLSSEANEHTAPKRPTAGREELKIRARLMKDPGRNITKVYCFRKRLFWVDSCSNKEYMSNFWE